MPEASNVYRKKMINGKFKKMPEAPNDYRRSMISGNSKRCLRHHMFIEGTSLVGNSTPPGVVPFHRYAFFYKHVNPPGLERKVVAIDL
jgi:hypothetical protein